MIPISDLAAEMQKNLDALDDANLFRKAFGNMQEALKYIKVTWYYLDSMVLKIYIIRIKKISGRNFIFLNIL
jgi:hypothetical protein